MKSIEKGAYLSGLLFFVVGFIKFLTEPFGFTFERLLATGAIILGSFIIWFSLDKKEESK